MIEPNLKLLNLLLASTLQAQGRAKPTEVVAYLSESIFPLRVAAKALPTSVLPHVQLAAVFTELGNTNAAASEREQSMLLQYPEVWPLIVAARKARENRQYSQAITLLREALAKQPDLSSCEIELAAALMLSGQGVDAEPVLLEMAQQAIDDGAAYQALEEVVQITELASLKAGKPTRELGDKSESSKRVRDYFLKYRRNQSVSADSPPPAIAPFDAEQAQQHQVAWAKYLKVPVEYTNSIGMRFVLIPPGEFTMGGSKAEIEESVKVLIGINIHGLWQASTRSEAPQHKVILTQPIYLGRHEVTQAQYEAVMGMNPSHFAATGIGKAAVAEMGTANFPVEMVDWNDAGKFCAKLSHQENLRPFSLPDKPAELPEDGNGYRLPTEAEWEFSCRAGTTTKCWIGDTDGDMRLAGWVGGAGRTHPVGKLKANPFGLYDTHGNVWEWVQDQWGLAYYGQFQGRCAIDPCDHSSGNAYRIRCGGSWMCFGPFLLASCRNPMPPSPGFNDIGFRVVLTVNAVTAARAKRETTPASDDDH